MSIFRTSLLSIRKPNQQQVQSNGSPPSWAIDVVCVTALVVYFLHFALPAVGGNLNEDEMAELWRYWYIGPLKWLWANICFWTPSPFFRPGGVFYYWPLYHFFGLAPQPYRIVQIAILAASIPILYYLSRCLASSRLIAFLATLALCYHAGLISLVFIGSFSYDVLCGLFYFAALSYYLHIRETEAHLRPLQLIGFLALYVSALDFKEMAVTLPVIILIYELLKCHRWSDWRQFIGWARSSAVPALVAGLLTALYIYGKTHGPGALIKQHAYRPRYSWSHFLTTNAHFVSELFYGFAIPKKALLGLWALVFIYAFLRRDRMLRLMAFWIVIVPLPLAFIPLRGGAHLYLLLFGWAMIFAKVASDLITLISKSSILIGQGAAVGAATGAIIGGVATGRVRGAALGAAAGAAAGRMSAATFRIVATLMVASALAIFTQWENQRFDLIHAFLRVGQKTSHVIQAFHSLDLHPAPGSTILLLQKEELFQNKWNLLFAAYLIWNDHSLSIYVDGQDQAPMLSIGPLGFTSGTLTEQQIATMDYIISLTEFQAKLVRAPDSDHP